LLHAHTQVGHVLLDEAAGANDATLADLDVIAERRVYANKRILAD
jgi:hypothetical protein